jgi:GNAT superfamily N-acetyltransferase
LCDAGLPKHTESRAYSIAQKTPQKFLAFALWLCGFVVDNPAAMNVEVTRTYLQVLQPSDLNAAHLDDARVRIDLAVNAPASFYRFLYAEVGKFYHWIDRLRWTDDEIRAHLERNDISLWVMYYEGSPAGYFELEKHNDASSEIAYFGLLPEFIGKGLGKHLLTVAVEQAWSDGASRVWLHTCTLDDVAAMPNYVRRGFQPFKTETYFTEIAPDEELRAPI